MTVSDNVIPKIHKNESIGHIFICFNISQFSVQPLPYPNKIYYWSFSRYDLRTNYFLCHLMNLSMLDAKDWSHFRVLIDLIYVYTILVLYLWRLIKVVEVIKISNESFEQITDQLLQTIFTLENLACLNNTINGFSLFSVIVCR